ncbi:hypothetical protein [Streptomyces sp. NPDC001792]|uniref:hypothetical protein n=1 Tax=unclassified Streptomyces TaxID=2593676 RepID=UPI0033317944
MRLRTSHGRKGDHHYDRAMLDIHPADSPDHHAPGHAVVLVRRHRYTRELSFSRCHSTTPVTLATLVGMVCACPLDQGQATSWNSWSACRCRQPGCDFWVRSAHSTTELSTEAVAAEAAPPLRRRLDGQQRSAACSRPCGADSRDYRSA